MRIVLIYDDYFKDGVGLITEELAKEGVNTVYHIPQEDAKDFIENNGQFAKIYFTDKVSPANKAIFSKKPYNAKKIT